MAHTGRARLRSWQGKPADKGVQPPRPAAPCCCLTVGLEHPCDLLEDLERPCEVVDRDDARDHVEALVREGEGRVLVQVLQAEAGRERWL